MRGNGMPHCCGKEPMLRVNKKNSRLRFECKQCERHPRWSPTETAAEEQWTNLMRKIASDFYEESLSQP